MKLTVICDIDGTIADLTHRRHWVTSKPKNWAAFYAAMDSDTPIEPVCELVRRLKLAGAVVLFVSGREGNKINRDVTREWLKRNDLYEDSPFFLFMRQEGDHRADYIVKEEIYNHILDLGFTPTIAIDDRDQCVQLWRRLGLVCLQAAEGNF